MIEVKGKLRLGDDGKFRFLHESGRATCLVPTPELRAELEAHVCFLIGEVEKKDLADEPAVDPLSVDMCRDCRSPIQGISYRWAIEGEGVLLLCHDCHSVRLDRRRRVRGAQGEQEATQKCPICLGDMSDEEKLGAMIAGKYIPMCPTCFSRWQDQVAGYVNMPASPGEKSPPPFRCRICNVIVPMADQRWPRVASKFIGMCPDCFEHWKKQVEQLSAPATSTTVVTWEEVKPPKEGVSVPVKKAGKPKKAKKAPNKKSKKSAKKG